MTDDKLKALMALADEVAEDAPRAAGELVYSLHPEDTYNWRRHCEACDADNMLLDWQQDDARWPGFGREVMARLYSGDARDEAANPEEWAQRCHDIASELPEWDEALALCDADRWNAGCFAIALAKATIQVHKENDASPPESPSDEPQGDGGDDADEGENARQGADGGSQGDESTEPGEGEPQSSDSEPDISDSQLRNALRGALRQASQEAHEEAEAISCLGYGLSDDGDPESGINEAERIKLTKMLRDNPRLKLIVQEMGRLMRMARAKRRTQVDAVQEEIADVGIGQSLQRMLPAEAVMLSDPLFRWEAMRRFIERQQLVYELTGRDTAEAGPVGVALDTSASMQGESMIYGVATTCAIVANATRERRAAVVVLFNGSLREKHVVTRDNFLQLVAHLASFPASGGTNWETPLDAMRGYIDEDADFDKADMVLVTDGICRTSDTWLKDFHAWRKERGVTLYAMLIGDERIDSLAFADQVHSIADIAKQGGKAAASVIASVKGV